MIIVPAWIEKESEKGIWVVLGSSPGREVQPEWIPKECISSCVYADENQTPKSTKRLAMIVMAEGDLPEKIKKILEKK
jgi:hypothetical protein